MLERILAATDGSDHATKALAIASDLAARNGAALTIVHVMNEDEPLGDLARFAETELLPEAPERQEVQIVDTMPQAPLVMETVDLANDRAPAVRRHIGRYILRNAEEIAKDHGVSHVDCRLLEGAIADRIIESAEETGADAVVLGTRGLGDLKGALVGSVSHKVCDKAPCASITVKS